MKKPAFTIMAALIIFAQILCCNNLRAQGTNTSVPNITLPVTRKSSPTPPKKSTPPASTKKTEIAPPVPRKQPAKIEYNPSRWDAIARKIRFTVIQEDKLKNILAEERHAILNTRTEAAEKIKLILTPEQRKKWETSFKSAEADTSFSGNSKKRLLFNPVYLTEQFALNPEQRKSAFALSRDYIRKVGDIRSKTRKRIESVLTKSQMNEWEAITTTTYDAPPQIPAPSQNK